MTTEVNFPTDGTDEAVARPKRKGRGLGNLRARVLALCRPVWQTGAPKLPPRDDSGSRRTGGAEWRAAPPVCAGARGRRRQLATRGRSGEKR